MEHSRTPDHNPHFPDHLGNIVEYHRCVSGPDQRQSYMRSAAGSPVATSKILNYRYNSIADYIMLHML